MSAKAVCVLNGEVVKGTIFFNQGDTNAPVKITGAITGLGQGSHSLYIQEFRDNDGCTTSAEAHFNPSQKYWSPSDNGGHFFDLGHVEAGSNGVAKINISDNIISLDGEHSIIGGIVVVHLDLNELGKGGPTGNAGARLACGVIGLTEAPTR